MNLFKEDHWDRLPTIRIQKIVMDHFKSVGHGEIVFECGRKYIPQGTQSDILGIYGQNGSGKTSLIEALSILKYVLMGEGVPKAYASCIANDSNFSKLTFIFDLQYNDGRIRKVLYSFCMKAMQNIKASKNSPLDSVDDFFESMMEPVAAVRVFDECIQMGGDFYGENIKLQPIIDTSPTDLKNPFIPVSKRKWFIEDGSDAILMIHSINKILASEASQSFIFSNKTLEEFSKQSKPSEYSEVINELRLFASYNLFVVDTKIIGSISTDMALPLYANSMTSHYNLAANKLYTKDLTQEDIKTTNSLNAKMGVPNILPMSGSFIISEKEYEDFKNQFESMNLVLGQLVPGMNIAIKNLSETLTKTGEKGKVVELVTNRDGKDMPLRYESDGVKKIISILDLIIRAFNQKSTTIAIDEFDSGIFEYLLGEILETFQESGRGQFIFTSHNLRPLEVIDKKFLCFTTTNPDNRYVRLKNIGKTNNLRNVYYREIVLGEQDEELYRRTQQYKIAAALRKAGDRNA